MTEAIRRAAPAQRSQPHQSIPADWRSGFASLIITQFQVAFSDNALRFLVTFMGLALWASRRTSVVPLVGALFSAPFLLFSMAGGYLADRFSKRTVTICIKFFELAVMLAALVAIVQQNVTLGLACVFLMGTHSAFFGPSKYGLLPELLPEERLSWGNGILEMGTFMAIILGSQTGAWMYAAFRVQRIWPGVIFAGLALAGLIFSLGISRVPAADPGKLFRANFLGDLFRQVQLIRRDRVLWLAAIGNVYFSFLGMLVQQNIVLYGTDTLAVNEIRTGYLMAALALGIGIGSVAAGYLSGGKIEYGLIPLGAMGMTVLSFALGRNTASYWTGFAELAFLGFWGGFFIVPISAILQHRPEKGRKGAVLAAANLLSFVGIFIASGVYYAITASGHIKPPSIFLLGGLATLAGTIYTVILLPDSPVRLLLWIATETFWRIRINGREYLPETGPVLLVCERVSMIDSLLLLASTDRTIRFLVPPPNAGNLLLKWLQRMLPIIPLASEPSRQGPFVLEQTLKTLQAGEILCASCESLILLRANGVTFAHALNQSERAPLIPIHLDKRGNTARRRFPSHVTISYGQPMPFDSTPQAVRQHIQELSSRAYEHHRRWMRTIPRAFIRAARRHPFRFAMADARSGALRFGTALARTIFLARRLKPEWRDQSAVGILLPPSVAGALVNHAALLMGKAPVNLSYTVPDEARFSAAQQCGIATVITSRAFLAHMKLQVPGKTVFLEDLASAPRWTEKIAALLMAWLLPSRLLERSLGCAAPASLDDLATIIFSSGSTGDPKGVMLTHFNIAANIEQIEQAFALEQHDRMLGILPFFHAFGFTITIALPAALGIGAVFHPNPLDAAIGQLVSEHRATIMVATPTFLLTYLRRCSRQEFSTLRLIMAGAEKLPESLAEQFESKFRIRPLEGYGCTECAPVVAANQDDVWEGGVRRPGAKPGTIGRPLPGIAVRVVNPETGEPVPTGQSGLLLVRGPNVMKGYLHQPERTAEVLRDGWYNTGDIVTSDEDGFLKIMDRLSRFSKIGGELVPHVKIEDKLHELAGVTERTFVVVGVPDSRKGERLVVLHTLLNEQLHELIHNLSALDLPNLWRPRPNQFFHVAAFPYLGTGKLDLRKIREMALQISTSA